MKKAKRYTLIKDNGKVKAECHDGYVNSYMDYMDNVPVNYFVYRDSKFNVWYAVDMQTGMAITSAKKRKDLGRLDCKTVESLYLIRQTEYYKEMVEQFRLLVAKEA